MRDLARELAKETEPMLIIGSPMCKAFSTLQALSKNRRDPEVVRRSLAEAEMHVRFCC